MSKLECETIAQELLSDFGINYRHPQLFEKLVSKIEELGHAPKIRLFYDSKTEETCFEVIE